jgi:hypothetical protein
MAALSNEEIRAAFDSPLLEAPERLQTFFANAGYDLDGLETALGYLSAGIVGEAVERMTLWHGEFAHLGYKGWAESYFAEVQRKNQFTLPNALSLDEQAYLDTWRAKVRSLIERSAEAVA